MKINVLKYKKAYFIGIKGVGMTMLAQFLAAKKIKVFGSDNAETFMTDKVLQDSGIKIFSPFAIENIPNDADLIIYSSAYNAQNNIEMAFLEKQAELLKSKTVVLSYAEALGAIFNNYFGIAVCGSHGKTTTSAWLGYVLMVAGKKPNVLVGSRVPQFKGSALIGKSKYFIAETDEYQNKLQFFHPQGVLLNNIDYDHPDFFKTEADYEKVFRDFVKKIPSSGFLIVDSSDVKSLRVSKSTKANIITYDIAVDLSSAAKNRIINYLAYDIKIKGNYQVFKINALGEFKISLFGEHNIKNALAVVAAARELGISVKQIKSILASFKGTERRAQILGKFKGALIIDDYAHHPTEIKATLNGLRNFYKKKNIITVFHPHTFTRTKALFKDFVTSFSDTNELIVLDIYGSAREKQGGVSSTQLVKAIIADDKKNKIKRQVKNIKTIPEVGEYLRQKINSNDLVVLMGAGDVFRVADKLIVKK